MKKKILVIHPSLALGGAEKMIAFLCNIFANKYKISLLLLKRDEILLNINKQVDIYTEEVYSKQPIIGINLLSGIKNIKHMVFIIKQYYKKIEPDLVICFDIRTLLAVYIGLKKNRDKILFSERADPYENRIYWQIILKRIYSKIRFIVFQTNEARNFYGKLVSKKSCIINNPALNRELTLNFDNINNETNKKNYIFAAGRLQYRKGFDLLIQAYYKTFGMNKDIKLYIYGDGSEKIKLINLINKLNLGNNVFILPPEPNIITKHKDAKLFVLPSRSEGIPNILIEAILAEIPCVATDCSPGGARLITDNGNVGLLAKCNNVDSLSKYLNFAKNNYQFILEMTKIAKNSMKRFDPDKISNEWRNIIEKII